MTVRMVKKVLLFYVCLLPVACLGAVLGVFFS